MARKSRIDKIGFYHVINRGVAKNNIYCGNDDSLKFLEIQEASDEYDFETHSFCLINNHYNY